MWKDTVCRFDSCISVVKTRVETKPHWLRLRSILKQKTQKLILAHNIFKNWGQVMESDGYMNTWHCLIRPWIQPCQCCLFGGFPTTYYLVLFTGDKVQPRTFWMPNSSSATEPQLLPKPHTFLIAPSIPDHDVSISSSGTEYSYKRYAMRIKPIAQCRNILLMKQQFIFHFL